jgi:flagellar biosynthesis GTPase FlhF
MDNKNPLIPLGGKLGVGFWRGVGYFISILMIISGFLGALYTYGLSLVGAILGFIFIWMLKGSASRERMEKYLKQMRDSTETDEQRTKRKYEEDSSHCANCGKWMPWWNTKPLCKECRNKEMESSDAEMDLANDEKKLAELESEKQNGEEEKRTFSEKQEKELKDEEELREEQGIKDEIKRLEERKKQLEKDKGEIE